MRLTDERPEDELHGARASELLTILALVHQATGGRPGSGAMPCPSCRAGTITYTVVARGAERRPLIAARCSTAGCIKFS